MLNKLSGFGKKMYCGFKNCFLHSSDNFTKELKLFLEKSKNSWFMTLRLF